MMVNVSIPKVCLNEQRYILDVMLDEFLGLGFNVTVHDEPIIKFSMLGADTNLTVNADFFHKADENWLKKGSMPELPLHDWKTVQDGLNVSLVEDMLPVLYGHAGLVKEGNHWHLNLDVFGSAFFMLSRYEELITQDRDEHDRFPASASVAFKANFLDRPIVNEYLEILWACMHQLWPSLERKKRRFRSLVSCDVDHPIDTAGYSLKRTVFRVGDKLLNDRNVPLAFLDAMNYVFKKFGSDKFDEYRNNIKWIMDVNDKETNRVAFFFIPQQTSTSYESVHGFTEDKMRNLLTKIIQRGHEIGFHPGYETFRFPKNFRMSADILKCVYHKLGVKHSGGRQHYLRYDASVTPKLWDDNGFTYDSSLGFADRAGFRCGVCYEYTMFDLTNRVPLNVKQRPLVAMDCSVISDGYEGLGYTKKAFERFELLKGRCKQFDGDFTLLWHNSFFGNKNSKKFYLGLIPN
jgi:hypothetical protein